MISQLDMIHIVRRIVTPIVTILSLSSGLKPELAYTVVPFILQQVEQLTKTDLADVSNQKRIITFYQGRGQSVEISSTLKLATLLLLAVLPIQSLIS
jgi:hypothetical protein